MLMEMWWDAKTDQRRRMREEEEWKWKQQIVRKTKQNMVSTTYTQAHTHETVY